MATTATPPTCNFRPNSTTPSVFGLEGYEGIPFNLVVNIASFLGILIVFSILRKLAVGHSRSSILPKLDQHINSNKSTTTVTKGYNVWTQLFFGHSQNNNREDEKEDDVSNMEEVKEGSGFMSWFIALWKIRDKHILYRSGRDALQYLAFQKYLIILVSVLCLVCVAVILPINLQGKLESENEAFARTSISNISSHSLLWVHAIFSVLFLVLSLWFMRHFSNNLIREIEEHTSRTIMVCDIPKDKCYKNLVTKHFKEAYPHIVVEDVCFAFDVTYLMAVDKKRRAANDAKHFSQRHLEQTGERLQVVPRTCGNTCACGDKVDALEFYAGEEDEYRDKVETAKVSSWNKPLGIAFITFANLAMANEVLFDHRNALANKLVAKLSNVSTELRVDKWVAIYAPSPDDIRWENLSVPPRRMYVKSILINLLVFILLFFLTTPTMVLNLLDTLNYQEAVEKLNSPLVSQFLPTLLLWLFSSILPVVIWYGDQFLSHWTKTEEHASVMRKTYIFLLFMVLILPSLGLTSANAFFEWAINSELGLKHNSTEFRWECVFLADSGALFVNYVITSALIGTALELLRFTELFSYGIRLLFLRSKAETFTVRKNTLWEFQYGTQYAWILTIFTIIMAYSVLCPLVVPFGLIYLICKHLADKYNIYFAYSPSRIDTKIHNSAITYVIFSVILLQICLLFFFSLKVGFGTGVVIFMSVIVFVTLGLFIGRFVFGASKQIFRAFEPAYKGLSSQGKRESSPAPTPQTTHGDDEEDKYESNFLPNILKPSGDSDDRDGGVSPSHVQPSYGATNVSGPTTDHSEG